MTNSGDGYHSITLPDVGTGTRYAYQLGDGGTFPDPASRWQPDGVHRPSAVYFPEEFEWHDRDWPGVVMRDLAIYELHPGTFTAEGTFEAIIPRLRQLKELGITAIEIMPVSQFPGTRNWGYDGVHPYAAQNSYGGPLGLMRLVDAAHLAGLGVILDVVYNHLGPEGNYLSQFGPYFTDRHHTPWGCALNYDGPDSDPVRRYVIDNACQWIRDFHIDGLRLDAVQTILDVGAYHLLAELQAEVQATATAVGRSTVIIAETNENDAHLTRCVEKNGFGLDGVWCDDFHHAVHALLTGERDGYYLDFGQPEQLAKAYEDMFVFDGCYSPYFRRRHGSRVTDQPREHFVVCIQNHDQIGNRALGERIATLLAPAAQRLAAGLMLISPGTPMLYMGEEYGETRPFLFFCSYEDARLNEAVRDGRKREFAELAFRWSADIPDATSPETFERSKLEWRWEDDPHRAGLRQLYRTLLAARRSWPGLVDREHCRARIVGTADTPILVVERGETSSFLAIANLSANAVALPPIDLRNRPLTFSSEERQFDGSREGLHSANNLLAYELLVFGK